MRVSKKDLLSRIVKLEQASRLGLSIDDIKSKQESRKKFEVGDKFVLPESHPIREELKFGTVLEIKSIDKNNTVIFEGGWHGGTGYRKIHIGGVDKPLVEYREDCEIFSGGKKMKLKKYLKTVGSWDYLKHPFEPVFYSDGIYVFDEVDIDNPNLSYPYVIWKE